MKNGYTMTRTLTCEDCETDITTGQWRRFFGQDHAVYLSNETEFFCGCQRPLALIVRPALTFRQQLEKLMKQLQTESNTARDQGVDPSIAYTTRQYNTGKANGLGTASEALFVLLAENPEEEEG